MSSGIKPTQASRRAFIKGMAVVGGSATLLTMSKGAIADTQQEQEEMPASNANSSKGYHMTAHIRDYYDKVRF